jgi:biotin transport system substrate-specific component
MSALGSNLRTWASHEVVPSRTGRRSVAISAFVVATALGAYAMVPLPWTPVPMTLQPLVVILAGALLGPMLGAAAMSTYLVIGALGLPVFSGGGAGVAWLMGPTGGYLLAYPAAALVTGWLAGGRDAGAVRLFGALAAGIAVVYLGGVAQLALLTGGTPASLLALGVLPFVAGDLVKVVLALLVALRLRPKTLDRVAPEA